MTTQHLKGCEVPAQIRLYGHGRKCSCDLYTLHAMTEGDRVDAELFATRELQRYRGPKTRGQVRYEASIAERPLYHDGTQRKSWAQLDSLMRWTWER